MYNKRYTIVQEFNQIKLRYPISRIKVLRSNNYKHIVSRIFSQIVYTLQKFFYSRSRRCRNAKKNSPISTRKRKNFMSKFKSVNWLHALSLRCGRQTSSSTRSESKMSRPVQYKNGFGVLYYYHSSSVDTYIYINIVYLPIYIYKKFALSLPKNLWCAIRILS